MPWPSRLWPGRDTQQLLQASPWGVGASQEAGEATGETRVLSLGVGGVKGTGKFETPQTGMEGVGGGWGQADVRVRDVGGAVRMLALLTGSERSDISSMVHRLVSSWGEAEGGGGDLWTHACRPRHAAGVCCNRSGVTTLLHTLRDMLKGPKEAGNLKDLASETRQHKAKRLRGASGLASASQVCHKEPCLP